MAYFDDGPLYVSLKDDTRVVLRPGQEEAKKEHKRSYFSIENDKTGVFSNAGD